jgi:hypothetical protein
MIESSLLVVRPYLPTLNFGLLKPLELGLFVLKVYAATSFVAQCRCKLPWHRKFVRRSILDFAIAEISAGYWGIPRASLSACRSAPSL